MAQLLKETYSAYNDTTCERYILTPDLGLAIKSAEKSAKKGDKILISHGYVDDYKGYTTDRIVISYIKY